MRRYFLEWSVMIQAALVFVCACILIADRSVSSLSRDLLLALLLISTLSVFVFRSNHSVRYLFRRRAAGILQSKQRLERQHAALQQVARSRAIHEGSPVRAVRELIEVAAKTVETDWVGIWIFEELGTRIRCLGEWQRGGRRIDSGTHYLVADLPPFVDEIRRRRVIAVDDIDQVPYLAAFRGVLWRDVHSLMIAPVLLHGRVEGLVCLGDRGAGRSWHNDEQNFVGSVSDMVALVLEVRVRRQIEEDLRRKSLAIESSLDGMAILNADEEFTYINEAHARVYGYDSPEELIGRTWHILYQEDELRRFKHELFPLFLKRGRLRIEAIGKRRDGSVFPQEVCLTAIPGGGLICTVRDISATKAVESRLRESQRFLRTVIDSDPNLIFVKDPEGRFTLVNQAVADIYGTTVEAIVGKRDSDFNSHPEEVEHFNTDDRRVMETLQEVFVAEERITDARGAMHVLQTVKRPLRIEPGGRVHVLGVATDITQNKELHMQLVQSQKMEAIGQLAGGIAHDFNNLLTGIIGYADLLRSMSGDPQEVRRAAEMIGSAAGRAAGLTEKLLGFARKGKNQNIPVDLHETIRDSFMILGRTLEKNLVISERLGASSAVILGDPVQMEQIILNLAINARDAMSESDGPGRMGKLSVTTASTPVAAGDPRFHGLRAGQYLEISVSDTGCGIPQPIQERIFEPFFTTKEEGRGTGMGLAMVYGIVKNHGGTIAVDSVEGQGTSFRVYLPLYHGVVESPAPHVPKEAILGQGRIMVVDDHNIIRDVTCEMLASLGYDVVVAEDGMEAARIYEAEHQRIDLVILDMVMPRMGALECFRALRAINPGVRVILSTGYGNNNAVQEILNEGVVWFIQKPYQLRKLSEVVARALASDQQEVDREGAGQLAAAG